MWPFNNRASVLFRTFTFSNEPEAADTAPPERWDVDMALKAREIAALYQSKGWRVAGTQGEYPTGREILEIVVRLANSVLDDPRHKYNNTARLLAIRDADFPDSVDLYLYIGHASTAMTDDNNGSGTPD